MTPQQRICEIGKLVGNTPMVKITYTYRGKQCILFAKLEYFNFSGSIKDRMAYHILKKSYAEGLIKPGDRIVEATSGNTGPEIRRQLNSIELEPDAFVAGVGTGGTIMGVSAYLKNYNPQVKAHPLEPANSPTMSAGHCVGKHRIQGISDEFIPSIVKLDRLDKIVEVDDGDSIIMAQKLATSLGLGVGISSGGNFLGAVKLQHETPASTSLPYFQTATKNTCPPITVNRSL